MLRHSILLTLLIGTLSTCQINSGGDAQPNILWITIEDLTPMIGCYGDQVALTPTIDKLAEKGVKYTNAYATAAVCSPARSCLLTGVYATTLGTQHLRSETEVPRSIVPFPRYLREKGYYCTNNYKEDYNFNPENVWDESSKDAHWRNRTNTAEPFFAVFNLETTHQSRIFGSDSIYNERFSKYLPNIERTNPGDITLPSYFFDTPEIRNLWARYYDNVQIVDLQVKEIIDQLKEDGLEENTIIFFYADHGTGMPRGKRALYDSGLKVPFIISAPEKYQKVFDLAPNTTNEQLVSFVDFAPTILNMLNVDIPTFMQGRPFLGDGSDREKEYVYATADRVDEAYEIVRSVRTAQYRYVRNFLPHLPLIQPNFYSDQSEIMQEVYKVIHSNPEMTLAQKSMWSEKRPVEELYNVTIDPDETNNLAHDPDYSEVLNKLRNINTEIMLESHDSGLAPEAYMYAVSDNFAPYDILKDSTIYPMKSILKMLDRLYSGRASHEEVLGYLNDSQPLINYWAMIWLQYQDDLHAEFMEILLSKINEDESFVSITAAETLCKYGYEKNAMNTLIDALNSANEYNLLMAARAVELLGDKAIPYQVKNQSIL